MAHREDSRSGSPRAARCLARGDPDHPAAGVAFLIRHRHVRAAPGPAVCGVARGVDRGAVPRPADERDPPPRSSFRAGRFSRRCRRSATIICSTATGWETTAPASGMNCRRPAAAPGSTWCGTPPGGEKKWLLDATRGLLGDPSVRRPSVVYTVHYAILLSVVVTAPHVPGAVATQFMLVRSPGAASETGPQPVFRSARHRLA